MPRILSISRNPRLLALRNDALALAGYSVASPRQPNEALPLMAQQSFDAVIIGHSVEPEIRRVLIPAVRRLRPEIPIVFVYAAPEIHEERLADFSIDITAGPTSLLRALEERLSKT